MKEYTISPEIIHEKPTSTSTEIKSCMAKDDYEILAREHSEKEARKIMLLAAALHNDSKKRIMNKD